MTSGPIPYYLTQPNPNGMPSYGQPPAEDAPPAVDFSKFDLTKPADQKALLGHLQTMYGDQQKLADMATASQEDPYKGGIGGQPQLGQPGVNGIVNIWDPQTAGSNSS